jgi:ribosomal protein S18 acetylase RimI-like enzyme
MNEIIREINPARDSEPLIALWRRVFNYSAPHNAPRFVLDNKIAAADGLLFVAEIDGKIVGGIMAGYDGHRGWLYSLAVLPEHRRRGIGSRLVRHAEARLIDLGCPKINLQIMEGNENVAAFYHRLGYQTEQRVSMGKQVEGR